MKIINLTQHEPSPQQVNAGVISERSDEIKALLDFAEMPTFSNIKFKANKLALIAKAVSKTTEATHAMIGGAPYLMAPLEKSLMTLGIIPVYSFSKRVSYETLDKEGKVIKVSEFVHQGFVSVELNS